MGSSGSTTIPTGIDQGRKSAARLDPLLLPVLANRFDAIVREMTNTLFRVARSAVLAAARDLSCSIVTADNRLISSVEGIPVHVFGSHLQTQAMCDLHPDLEEGDAFLHNDPYLGNTHSADHTIIVPVFAEGQHLFTACAKAHQADIGNSEPTTYMPFAKDIYEEGALNFPCVRVQRDYRDVADIIRMCRRRIRVPDQWYGDYLAGIGAARIAERRLQELVQEYGVETLQSFIEEWFDYSERRMIRAIERLPSGQLVAEGWHDPFPAVPEGIKIKVVISVDAEAGNLEVDLRENPDCVPAGVNQSQACATNNVMIGIFNSLGADIPHNAGSFRRIKVHLRENCCVGIPVPPTSCSMATTNLSGVLINTTQRAFATIGDGWGLAAGGNSLGAGQSVISGKEGDTDYVNQFFASFCGGPASPMADGWVTFLHTVCNGVSLLDSLEILESKYPVRFGFRRVVVDTGGAGRLRGAPGTSISFTPTKDSMIAAYATTDTEYPPAGVHGGHAGKPAWVTKTDLDGKVHLLPPIPLEGIQLQPGEWLAGGSSGGGGYGNPLEREPERVAQDVREGWVSREEASKTYGVVLVDDEAGLLTVEAERTAAKRASLAGTLLG